MAHCKCLFCKWFCQLPGLDSNLDKENQNPKSLRRKPNPYKHIPNLDDAGRTTGRTRPGEEQLSEGGIPDTELAALVTAWPTLPDHIRAAIRALLATVPATPTPVTGPS